LAGQLHHDQSLDPSPGRELYSAVWASRTAHDPSGATHQSWAHHVSGTTLQAPGQPGGLLSVRGWAPEDPSGRGVQSYVRGDLSSSANPATAPLVDSGGAAAHSRPALVPPAINVHTSSPTFPQIDVFPVLPTPPVLPSIFLPYISSRQSYNESDTTPSSPTVPQV
jgi:hypothetical protein